jgi:hypothetical protein
MAAALVAPGVMAGAVEPEIEVTNLSALPHRKRLSNQSTARRCMVRTTRPRCIASPRNDVDWNAMMRDSK